ncbi:MAG: peroxidase-related enzyme [Parasphingorhabdus sp.]
MTRMVLSDPGTAIGEAADILEQVMTEFGTIPNVFKLLAISPALLGTYASATQSLEAGTLPARVRELIAVAIASDNACEYCLAAHAAGGRAAGLNAEELEAATRFTASDDTEGAALTFVRAAIDTAGNVSDERLEQVRAAGWSDPAILEMLGHIALNQLTNMANRLVDTPNDMPKHTLKPKGRIT